MQTPRLHPVSLGVNERVLDRKGSSIQFGFNNGIAVEF